MQGEMVGKGLTPRYERHLEKHQERKTGEHCSVGSREENQYFSRKNLATKKKHPTLEKPANTKEQKK